MGVGLVHILMLMAFVQEESGSIIDHNSYVNPKYGTGPSMLESHVAFLNTEGQDSLLTKATQARITSETFSVKGSFGGETDFVNPTADSVCITLHLIPGNSAQF